jgi:hypothetical protein
MKGHKIDSYFQTQASALDATVSAADEMGYIIKYPDRIWAEHVNYGHTVKYSFPLIVKKTGNHAKKRLHITLYRMDSGSYELTYYFN